MLSEPWDVGIAQHNLESWEEYERSAVRQWHGLLSDGLMAEADTTLVAVFFLRVAPCHSYPSPVCSKLHCSSGKVPSRVSLLCSFVDWLP